MYLEHFGLKDYPFRITPDTDYLYMSSSHSRAMNYMKYAVVNREGFIVITGDIGSGKTTLIKKIISNLDDDVIVAKIFQTQLNEEEFLQSILVEFGINPFNAKKVELLTMLNQFLVDCYAEKKQVILIVDDAQNLNKRVLEEVKLLSCVETNKDKLINVILVGQPELKSKIEAPDMEQLLQRVSLRFHVKKLSEEETVEYINHRLKIAGIDGGKIFDQNVYKEVYEYSGGTPRLINTLCDTAFTCAYADGKQKVTLDVVAEAVDELQWKKDKGKSVNKKLSVLDAEPGSQEDYLYQDTEFTTLKHVEQNSASINKALIDISWQLTRIADYLEVKSTADIKKSSTLVTLDSKKTN